MIIRTLCNSCLQPYEIILEASDLSLLKQISDAEGHTCPCPRLCGGSVLLAGDEVARAMTSDRRLKDPIRIGGKELYRAVLGAGLPDEIARDGKVVESLLKSTSIKEVVVEEVGSTIFLHEIHLSNGVIMHLTSGQRGAQVLKMTKERVNGISNPG